MSNDATNARTAQSPTDVMRFVSEGLAEIADAVDMSLTTPVALDEIVRLCNVMTHAFGRLIDEAQGGAR